MPEPTQRPTLACERCRAQKVRCNRVTPSCERCLTRDEQCVYPQRAKRKRDRVVPRTTTSIADATLTAILDRLQIRLQQQSVSEPSPIIQKKPSTLRSLLPESPSSFGSSSLVSHDPSTPEIFGIAGEAHFDAMAILEDAVEQVKELRTHTFDKALVSDPVDIPRDVAKSLIRDCFNHMPRGMFVKIINQEVIETIPDIIHLPYIHLEPVIVVVYYTILYFGCALQPYDPTDKYLKLTYLGCLRALVAWHRKATASTIDLVAAIFLTNISTQLFDYDLSWKMAKLAGEFCKRLNMHNLDNEQSACIGDAEIDDERRCFWELLQMDSIFRLVFDQPPLLTPTEWKVNLPYFNKDTNQVSELPVITFLAGSRITFTILDFLGLLEDTRADPTLDIMSKTEGLCGDIHQVFKHWQLNELFANERGPGSRLWSLAHVLLTGYIAITFMLRKAAIYASVLSVKSNVDLCESPIMVDAGRNIVEIFGHLIDRHPNPHTLSALFGHYRGYVSYAYLANNIYRASNITQNAADLELLERLANKMSGLSQGLPDLVPLVRGIERINSELRQKLTKDSLQSPSQDDL